jgi:hypothetical protein
MTNNISIRNQWVNNGGYCGEVCLISAGLKYGQYISQYDAREATSKKGSQVEKELLLGVNDAYAAAQMHLKAEIWNKDKSTEKFLRWVKRNVTEGFPVAIGVFMNANRFYSDTRPNAGDDEYDHIVPVIRFDSNYPLTSDRYYGDDTITFSDNGIWQEKDKRPFLFSYCCKAFQANRQQANEKNGAVYSLPNNVDNYGIAIRGVMDNDNDTLPVCLETDVNYEKPISAKSNRRPDSIPVNLTLTVSDLEPNVLYNLYRYNNLNQVPDERFNTNAAKASDRWQIQISSGSTYERQLKIESHEAAIFRAVKASAQ